MLKRPLSRNQRSKGIKVKHVLQICLLLGVCFWLIYQVKHSHDKKKEFDDKGAKISVKTHSDDEILKLGRKDLPLVQEVAKNEKHEEEEEDAVEEEENKPEEEEKDIKKHEEEDHEEANKHEEVDHEEEEQEEANTHEQVQEEAGSKHEEEEQEEETKNAEMEEEKRGTADEEMDEEDQEKPEDEADREEEFIDEEKDREGEVDDRENEGNEGEEKNGQVENENLSDDNDHDVGDRTTHVAREEHYKADDASSAVSHDNQIIISETEKASSENSNENSERNILEGENKSNNTEEINGIQESTGLKLGEGVMAESGNTLDVTTTEEKDHGTGSYKPKDSSLSTVTNTTTEAGIEMSNNSTGLSTKTTGSSLQNGNETRLESSQAQNATLLGKSNPEATNLQTKLEQYNNSDTISNGNKSDSHLTTAKTMNADSATGDSFNNTEPILSEKITSLNATADGQVSSKSSTNETANTTQYETSNSDHDSGETHGSSDSSSTEETANGNSDNESGETNESLDSSSKNESEDAAKEDFIDSADSTIVQDDKESQLDLETLPDIRDSVDNSEDAAAE